MDNTANKLLVETITKEERTRWNHPLLQKMREERRGGQNGRTAEALISARGPRASSMTTPRSAAVRFLEEKTGTLAPAKDLPVREMLYRGVSHDGNGRVEYLRARKKCTVTERYGRPLTETHAYGWELGTGSASTAAASPNCRKPIIQKSFFRPMGVETHKNLPVWSGGTLS
mmetsp:Transcript_91492/g.259117  ORF Transcript_91492/g.259117 Transcript_91492/m.259117 type:complete len:172 (-) Transcript_91492:38-553(-)